ncbi:MAG: restriction endonuclease subunit S [Kiritimatiellae bacterium]|nr:restriction endonuclease subunit S [Kiritimatiellia bacterium]
MKASILDQAIRGKLVPQDPGDEPAAELLNRIKAEKARLIAAKKIKKEKVGESALQAIPSFSIPEGWIVSRIGKVFNLQAGENIASSSIFDIPFDKSVPCFGGNGIRGFVRSSNRTGVHAIVGRQGALCGNLNLSTDIFYATEHAVVVDCFAEVTARFAYWFLRAMNLNQFATATAQPGLSVAIIDQVEFPLPPLAEQKRIVAKIEELMPLVERYGKAEERRAKLNAALPADLEKSILQEAVQGSLTAKWREENKVDEPAAELLKRIKTEKAKLIAAKKIKKEKPLAPITDDEKPFDLPEGWEWCRLGEVGYLVRGSGIKRDETEKSGMPCLRYGEIYTSYYMVLDKPRSYVSESLFERCLHIESGDIVMTLTGENKEEIAKTLAYLGDDPIAAGGDLAVWKGHCCDPMFLSFMMYSPYMISKKADNSTGDIIVHTSAGKLSNIAIPLPPLAEQKAIVAKVEELLAQVRRLKAK